MKNQTEIPTHLRCVLKKMCKLVGTDYDEIDFKKKDWYLDHTWSEEDQEKFRQWIIRYLKGNRSARYELMRVPSRHNKFLEGFASGFILNYGWKTTKSTTS